MDTASSFSVQSVTQLGPASLRVRFTRIPFAADAARADDALNIANYTINGPAVNVVTQVAVVPDEPQMVDLAMAVPFIAGSWTLACSSAIQTPSGLSLQEPRSLTVSTQLLSTAEPVHGGAINDSAEGVIRKHLPPSLLGRAWDALVAALGASDRLNWENARLAFDQLFKSTASGHYLDRKVADDGLARPPAIGMPDDLFRQLSIKTSASKLTPQVLLEILEIFYGSDSVRASVTTDLTEPFALVDGDDLALLLDERDPVAVRFQDSDFSMASQASAPEVAAAITRALRLHRTHGFAVAIRDPSTDKARVRVYSGSLGLGSSVRVAGGRAQLGLNFPTLLTTYFGNVSGADNYNWVVTSPNTGIARLTLTYSGGSGKLDLAPVEADDYVVFEAVNSILPQGVYRIEDVGVSYSGSALVQSFDIEADVDEHTFLQLDSKELTFFRPTRSTIHQSNSRTVVVAQTLPSQLNVVIPATTQAVGRTIETAAYPHAPESLVISYCDRVSGLVTLTVGPHNLTAGSSIIVDGVVGGGFNGIFKIESTSTTQITYKTPDRPWSTVAGVERGTVTPLKANTSSRPGPYVLDPLTGAAVTSIETQATMDLFAGQQYGILTVEDASAFPDFEGWLVIGFGTNTAVHPVKYLGRLSSTVLILDYSFRFPTTNIRPKVTLLKQKGLYTPDGTEIGAAYLTASNAGRTAALAALADTVAAGVEINTRVVYPNDRGLGGEGLPTTGQKISDKIWVWGGDDLASELVKARGE